MIRCPKCDTANEPGSSFCMECGAPLIEQTDTDTIGGLETAPFEDIRQDTPKAPANAELEPGTMFAGRYRIERKIGHGGMGVVYLATETLAGKDRAIALKLIRADRLADQKAVDKLISEGALTQNIRHPNVVAVYNVGESDGQPFVAMEFVEGISLREWHRRQLAAKNEIPLDAIVAILKSILEGLDAAHRLEIVHRDLKPENVILTSTPSAEMATLKILDFGIARAPGAMESGTGTGLGTPRYMAPEQITNPSTAGPPADLYSLSIIFYELLMDVLPQGHWQPPSGGRSDVPHAIDALIEKGLSNRPASRQQNVAEYQAELTAALNADDSEKAIKKLDLGNIDENLDAYRSRWREFAKTKAGKITIGVAALIGLVALLPEEVWEDTPAENEVYYDDTYYNNVGDETTEDATDEETPLSLLEKAPDNPFAIMDGVWDDGMGGRYQVTTSADGTYNGSGRSGDGTAVQLTGSLTAGQYRGSAAGEPFVGQTVWDGGCDVKFRTFNVSNILVAAGMFHVDHSPDQNCPSRFNN